MNRRRFVAVSAGALLATPSLAWSQGQPAVRRVALLSAFARAEVEAVYHEFRIELEKLGWADGRNIALLELRTTDGRNDRLQAVADEIIGQAPDVILVQSVPATRALMRSTRSIPIVMVGVGNPVESGIVADYRKPGANVTGGGYLANESVGKLLQLLKEVAPRAKSVALFVNPSNDATAKAVNLAQVDATGLGMRLQVVEVTKPGDFEAAFAAIRREHTESILLPPEPLIRTNRVAIAEFATANRLPLAVTGSRRYLPAGGLISYGPTTSQYAHLAARYVDRILKGAKPGDLPVEEPSRFELAIDLRTAAALGLTVPQSVLLRADEVIR